MLNHRLAPKHRIPTYQTLDSRVESIFACLTNRTIEALAKEAAEAGDLVMVATCRSAVNGDEPSKWYVAGVLAKHEVESDMV